MPNLAPVADVQPGIGGLIDPSCPINWQHPLVLGTNLISWWKVVKNTGWGRGTILRDLVRGQRNPNDGTLSGTTIPVWHGNSPRNGLGSLKYDGSSARTKMARSSPIKNQLLTVAAWVNATGSAATKAIAGCQVTGTSGGDQFLLQTSAATVEQLSIDSGTAQTTTVGAGVLSTGSNTWYHLVGTYDGTTIRIYKNGIQTGSTAAASKMNTNPTSLFCVGATTNGANGSAFWPGFIDDVVYWNYAMSAFQVQQLFLESKRGSPTMLNWLDAEWQHIGATATAFIGDDDSEWLRYTPVTYW